MPLIKDLTHNFDTFDVDWVRRDKNVLADLVASTAVEPVKNKNINQPSEFKIDFPVRIDDLKVQAKQDSIDE